MEPGTPEWLAQVTEDIVDPDQRIVDPHHHLWKPDGAIPYGLDDLHADTGSGHKVEATVFVECHSSYRTDGPEHLRPVGETEYVTEAAKESATSGKAEIRGIVAHADLTSGPLLDETLDAHVAAADDLFKGIRHYVAHDDDPSALTIPGQAGPGVYANPDFRAGVARLGERGLTYDGWHYHHQLPEFGELAAATPGTTMVLDHFGTPLGVGRYADAREEIYQQWKIDIAAVAANDNVVAKLGGLAMPDNGFGWHTAETPPTSDEFVAAQERYYLHTCLLYTSPSPRDATLSRMPSSA